jgi:hypothetical protein
LAPAAKPVNGLGVIDKRRQACFSAKYGSLRSATPKRRKEVYRMRNRLLLWLPILTALALASLGAMDWGP